MQHLAPFVLSASRREDIPAFRLEHFMNQLHSGVYHRYGKPVFIVFWTKNASKLLQLVPKTSGWYVQYSLNDYQLEGWEPHVPALADRLDVFRELIDKFGIGHVVWRFDPICLGPRTNVDTVLDRYNRIAHTLDGYSERCVFSFVDDYGKAKANMQRAGIRKPTIEEEQQLMTGMLKINAGLTHPMRLMTCAESIQHPQGIEHSHCVDAELIQRFIPEQYKLWASTLTKDPSQRKACGCVRSVDVGEYRQCHHGCAYCYAM